MDTENRHYKLTSLIDGARLRKGWPAWVENKGTEGGSKSPLGPSGPERDGEGKKRGAPGRQIASFYPQKPPTYLREPSSAPRGMKGENAGVIEVNLSASA